MVNIYWSHSFACNNIIIYDYIYFYLETEI